MIWTYVSMKQDTFANKTLSIKRLNYMGRVCGECDNNSIMLWVMHFYRVIIH